VFGNRYQKQARNQNNPFPQYWTETSDITQSTNQFAANVDYDDAGNVLTDQKFIMEPRLVPGLRFCDSFQPRLSPYLELLPLRKTHSDAKIIST
jgi:hypothetical protein